MMRRAAWALLWSVWCVLVAAVPFGISLLLVRLDGDAWGDNDHGLVLLLMIAVPLFYIWVPVQAFLYVRHRWMGRTSTPRAVVCCAGVAVVLVGSFTAGILGQRDVEQQILHDRGVTSTGVVTGIRTHTSDSGAPTQDGVHVRMNDGRSFDVDGEPRVGSTVQVTADPLGRIPPRLGRRPAAPSGQALQVTLAVLAIGHVMAASITAGPLNRSPEPQRPRRRLAPSDETSVGKRSQSPHGVEPHS
ncbi:hypothetical protein LN042_32890 [Kitasatospora sp. RB6PN24]|uniref:hypothetical protein n=1 Tax=Kitasatospora humi TaxID=2893891 RepID=UPI001E39A244|nr:hypothetical protein [Kitasatospora humi]MCC9311806.1 hypothetical protein [Kitasatospora humi]